MHFVGKRQKLNGALPTDEESSSALGIGYPMTANQHLLDLEAILRLQFIWGIEAGGFQQPLVPASRGGKAL
jgi:hypothetical protein